LHQSCAFDFAVKMSPLRPVIRQEGLRRWKPPQRQLATSLLLALLLTCHSEFQPNPQASLFEDHHVAWHRHSYPSVYLNICSVNSYERVGLDGSLLVRRFDDVDRVLKRYCKHQSLTTEQCELLLGHMATVMTESLDAYNWIIAPAVDPASNATIYTVHFRRHYWLILL
jgi:hypothetical protein